jgi:HAE1 family hydrophobic/amphiphilic exporter-1
MLQRLIAGATATTVALAGFALPATAQQPATGAPSSPVTAPRTGTSSTPVAGDDTQGLPPPPAPAVLPAIPNIAPGYAAPVNPPLPSGDLVGVAQQPFVGVKLDDAITMALQRNTDLAVDESNARIANYQIVAAKGAYDVTFQLVPQYSHSVQPAESPFSTGPNSGPITEISSGATAAFNGQTPFGTRYSLSGTQQVVNNNTIFNSYNPYYNTAISLNLTQPLLRGTGGGDAARRQLIIATSQSEAQRAVLLTQASQTITNVSDTYWDLVAAWRDVGIQEQGLRNATAQAQSNTRLAQRGAAAPVDIVESNTQINVFQDNVFAALQQVQTLQNQLKSEILANPADPLWSANLVPTSAVLQLPTEPSLADLINSALKNRPEVSQLRAQYAVAGANLAYAKNQLLPQVDLGVGVTTSGFAGVPQNFSGAPFFQYLATQTSSLNALLNAYNATVPPSQQIPLVVPNFGTTPGYQTGKFGQSWQNAFDFRFPTYNISLTLQLPIQNRTAKADVAIANEQAKQIAVQEYGLLQRIRAEAANAIQSLREAQYRLASATAARVAADRVLLSEQRRFNAGTSTTFLVLQRQLDLANTEGRELSAQTDLNKAVVELNRVAGTNFAAYNIDVKSLGAVTLNGVTPATNVLPLPADAQASPPPPHR